MTWEPGHWIVAPILLPLAAGFVALVLPLRGSPRGAALRSAVSVASAITLLLVAALLTWWSAGGGYGVYRVGDWPVPVAIVLVLDRLSAMMMLLTAVVAVAVVLHVVRGGDRTNGESYFHPLFQLQLAGLNGAFLAGDLFNLFVFFEILLIASYCLLVLGGTTARVRSGLHYVILNLIGSGFFLFAVGALYGVTGTLNMAHMAQRVAVLDADGAALARVASLLLLVVFALKAALMPLYFWLPNAYAAAAAPVAALFALLTKVGVYSIVRFSTVVLGPASGGGAMAGLVEPWILPAALATIVLGTAGAYGAQELRRMQGYLLIASVGVMLAGIGAFTARSVGAGLYYLVHSTMAAAALFLLADIVAHSRGVAGCALVPGPRVARRRAAGALFFAAAVAMVGMPPLSGFIGKALILTGIPPVAYGRVVWAVILTASLLAIVALARAGALLFWGPHTGPDENAPPAAASVPAAPPPLSPAALLLVAIVLLTAAAEPAVRYTEAAAHELVTRGAAGYIEAVLQDPGGEER